MKLSIYLYGHAKPRYFHGDVEMPKDEACKLFWDDVWKSNPFKEIWEELKEINLELHAIDKEQLSYLRA